MTTYEELEKLYQPETADEKEALRRVFDNIGSWPECSGCENCIASCQMMQDDYEGLLLTQNDIGGLLERALSNNN